MYNLGKIITKNLDKYSQFNIDGLTDSSWLFLANGNYKNNLLLIAQSNLHINTLEKQLKFINPNVKTLKFPAWDSQPYDMTTPKLEIQAQRIKTAKTLKDNPNDNFIIITTIKALTEKTIDISELSPSLTLQVGKTYKRSELLNKLLELGFKRSEQVVQCLYFSLRGDVLDIFPNNLDRQAYRIIFFDNEIESIHTLDIETQRREESLDQICIEDLNELVLNDKNIATFSKNYTKVFPEGITDELYSDIKQSKLASNRFHFLNLFFDSELKTFMEYLDKNTVILFNEDVNRAISNEWDEINLNYNNRLEFLREQEVNNPNNTEVYRPIKPDSLYISKENLLDFFENNRYVSFSSLSELNNVKTIDSSAQQHPICYKNKISKNATAMSLFCDDLKIWQKQNYEIIISCFNKISAEHIKNSLKEYGISNIENIDNIDSNKKSKLVNIVISPIEFGIIDNDEKMVIISEQDIFGVKQKFQEKSKANNKKMIQHLNQLKVGDYVVHIKHGVGKFLGLENIKTSFAPAQDFAVIQYDNNEKLFIPIINLDTMSLYSHSETGAAKLDRLGSDSFINRKNKVKKQLLEMAQELIDVASKRALLQGFGFEPMTSLYNEFAEGFEYVLTPDQESCINDVLKDMYSHHPMDRLIIGDVGFGKTEIALRACLVCASNTKQACVIVPTTLLARQHFQTFKKRFENIGFKIACLSRLNTPKENKEIKQKLKTGEIDIVIGTHSLLAKDIKFKELGLLVVDEEQRFGVAHKEKIKAFKNTIDILTLSATPIPRTLHMSTSGVRDLSLMTTPPVDRQPIKTSIIKYDSSTIKQALLKEINRDGQVYIITPRVEGILNIAEKVSSLIPQAKIGIAHGQMNKNQLDKAMLDFSNGDTNILIATSIVESGIDIENANTMIVFDSHKFGLAQLYQIRGRIGRSSKSSFAYLLLPSFSKITDQALMRLKILKRLDKIGAGFELASYDMDIRGPGNILGSEQSGHIKQVGFSMYNQMLKDAVKKLQQNPDSILEEDDDFTPTVSVHWEFMIPSTYISDTNVRLDFYRRLSETQDLSQLEETYEELEDRFGPIPDLTQNLKQVIEFKIRAKHLNIESLEASKKGILIKFFKNEFKGDNKFIADVLSKPLKFKLKPDHSILFKCDNSTENSTIKNIEDLLSFIESFFDKNKKVVDNK